MIEVEMSEYSNQQLDAITCSAPKQICLAGAGTGKTKTLIGKLEYLINSKRAEPDEILLLTFTNAARDEIITRISDKIGARNFEIYTFHQFYYHLVRTDFRVTRALGYSEVPEVASTNIQLSIEKQCSNTLRTSLPKSAMSPNYNPKPNEKFEYKTLQKLLRSKLRYQNLITFDILNHDVSELFYFDDVIIQPYLDKFKYVIVDEFQDTDANEWKFIQAFEDKSSITIFGDIMQGIYEFRGADSTILQELLDDDKWVVTELDETFRCTQQICEYVNKFLDDHTDIIASAVRLNSNRFGPPVETHSKYNLVNILKSEIASDNIAILARTNFDVAIIVKKLSDSGISCNFNEDACSPSKFLSECPAINSNLKSNIYVGTIHSSKGLEYDTVLVYGVNSKSFKLDNSANCNLFYVACTRAINHLIVFDR